MKLTTIGNFLSFSFFLMGIALCLQLNAESPTPPQQSIVVFSIPKAGTHLLIKALKKIIIHEALVQLINDPGGEPCHLSTLEHNHFLNRDNPLEQLDLFENTIKLLQIRDPRDVILSQIDWLQREGEDGKAPYPWDTIPAEFIKEFKQLSFNEKISWAILMPDIYDPISLLVKRALDFIKKTTVFVCRFEDLVGAKGGGSVQKQEETVLALSTYLGQTLDRSKAAQFADELFGCNTLGKFGEDSHSMDTFRTGQIGDWKKQFNQEHIALFKQVMGKELIELGYETDDNW